MTQDAACFWKFLILIISIPLILYFATNIMFCKIFQKHANSKDNELKIMQ